MIGKIFKNFNISHVESITGLDATFLYGETPTSHMHVGSVAIIEGSLEWDIFKDIIESRIHQFPLLRKRLMMVPFNIDYPYWVDDPHFNLDLHIKRIALPKPGEWKNLREVASSIFSEPLDRSRPLWHYTFVEGIDGIKQVPKGSVAVISKIHHVAIDGVAGANMLSLLFDMTSKPAEIKKPKEFNPKGLPNEFELIAHSAVSFAKNPLKLPKIIANTVTATAKVGMLSRVQHLDLPTAPFTAPKTPLNGIIAAQRKWNSIILSLDRIKKIKAVMGTTVNDVILAFSAGALRRYLLEKGKLPGKPLVAMVPISVREKKDEKAGGNMVSNMLIQLATNIEDPIERLEKIHENTILGKTYQGAMGAKSIANMAEVVPYGIANQAAKLYTRYHLSKMHNPVFNVVITNVPGPQFPLYLQGHKLFAIMGTAPIIDGMGLIITIFSYNGEVTISSTSDSNSMPDIDNFSRYIREAANELEELVLKQEADLLKKKGRRKEKPESDQFFVHLKEQLKANSDKIKTDSGLFQFMVAGINSTEWILNLNVSPPTVRRGNAKNPDATFTIEEKNLMKVARGELKLQTAVIQGRLSIEGDSGKAMKLGGILSKMPKLSD